MGIAAKFYYARIWETTVRLLWRFRSTVYNTGKLRVKCVMYMIMRPCLENMAR